MKDKRLKKERDFKEVFNKGKRVYSKSLTVIYLKKESLKIGIAVSKKHGSAVKRNRIKRLIRVSFTPLKDVMKDYYVVIMPKIADEYDYNTFKKDIFYLLKKEKLLNEEISS
ncbi:MAG: ribonuclease P protein component [Christensenellaceae bacterium]